MPNYLDTEFRLLDADDPTHGFKFNCGGATTIHTLSFPGATGNLLVHNLAQSITEKKWFSDGTIQAGADGHSTLLTHDIAPSSNQTIYLPTSADEETLLTTADVGTLATVDSPCPIANGGTGATTLAGAGIPYVVATAAHADVAASILTTTLLATAPAGYYRATFYLRVSTTGDPGDYAIPKIMFYDASTSTVRAAYFDSADGAMQLSDPTAFLLDGSSTRVPSASIMFYHSEVTKNISYSLTFNVGGSPVGQFRLKLEYLGA